MPGLTTFRTSGPSTGFLFLTAFGEAPLPARILGHLGIPALPVPANRLAVVPGSATPPGVVALRSGDLELVGTIRLDGARGLRGELELTDALPHGDLVLAAYRRWGADLVDHLAGDFAFVLFDSGGGRLLAVRDQLGRRALYLRRLDSTLALGSSLQVLRNLPPRLDELDEQAIAEFLVFEGIADPARTPFAGIEAVPPGHTLGAGPDGLRVRRYWSLEVPADHRIAEADAAAELRAMLAEAIADRMPGTDRVGVAMSGGIDSTLIAALALDGGFAVEALTVAQDQVAVDLERPWVERVRAHLGIPVHRISSVGHPPWYTPRMGLWATPEPVGDPFLSLQEATARAAAEVGITVLLHGEGADDALACWPADAAAWARRQPVRYLRELVRESRRGRWPRPGLAAHWRGRLGLAQTVEAENLPRWLATDIARSFDLPARTARLGIDPRPTDFRPAATAALRHPRWRPFLRSVDSADHSGLVDLRFPFLDLRVLELLLALPILPWCRRKSILREAAKGLLPASVVERPKTFFPGDPIAIHLRAGAPLPELDLPPHPRLARYLEGRRPDPRTWLERTAIPWDEVRPICFDLWLKEAL